MRTDTFPFHDTRGPEDLFHVEQSGERRIGWMPGSEQVSCWVTYTSDKSAEIVRANLHKSAMYSGEIKGVGPRYCPSIEDKFVRFADKAAPHSIPGTRGQGNGRVLREWTFHEHARLMFSWIWCTAYRGLEHATDLPGVCRRI